MTEQLKTLKDLRFEKFAFKTEHDNFPYGDDVGIKIYLRQEAIKWIRQLKNELCKNSHNCDHCTDIFGTIGWIMIFFNLAEEDLK